MNKLALTSLTIATALGLGSSVFAGGRQAGSLLVFPVYNSVDGVATLITVTNTNDDASYDQSKGLANGTVDIEYKYIDYKTCREFNRTERLTPNDTITVVAAAHNAESALGYLYVFAKDTQNRKAISWNYLIGSEVTFDGIQTIEYGVNAWPFISPVAEGGATDLDVDGILDLDGSEYEQAPDELLFPRFLGQNPFVSRLTLINLTGGTRFSATADLLIYNDNEQVFSAEVTMSCWTTLALESISGAFTNAFLVTTNHDPREIVGFPSLESGWFRLDGGVASSTTTTIEDPAILGMMAEFVGVFGEADLPFERGVQDNGDLLPRGVDGDPKP